MKDDESERDEELNAIKAIYGDEAVQIQGKNRMCSIHVMRDGVEHEKLIVTCLFPEDYPSRSFPNVILQAPWLKKADTEEVIRMLKEKLFVESRRGDVLVFEICECLKEMDIVWSAAGHSCPLNSDSDIHACEPVRDKQIQIESDVSKIEIMHGPCIKDRKSTFIAHMARVYSPGDVSVFMDQLLSDHKINCASHNIMAYRLSSGGSDCDDDGENAAGKGLLNLLRMTDAVDVVVVVSRYFGGIHLGPDRFKV